MVWIQEAKLCWLEPPTESMPWMLLSEDLAGMFRVFTVCFIIMCRLFPCKHWKLRIQYRTGRDNTSTQKEHKKLGDNLLRIWAKFSLELLSCYIDYQGQLLCLIAWDLDPFLQIGHKYPGDVASTFSDPEWDFRTYLCSHWIYWCKYRFDRELVFPLPSHNARASILEIHTRKWSQPPSEDLRLHLADLCVGYCGADLKVLYFWFSSLSQYKNCTCTGLNFLPRFGHQQCCQFCCPILSLGNLKSSLNALTILNPTNLYSLFKRNMQACSMYLIFVSFTTFKSYKSSFPFHHMLFTLTRVSIAYLEKEDPTFFMNCLLI